MANQNPQPEVYTTRHTFTGVASGASDTQTVFTNQANNETVRISALSVSMLTSAGIPIAAVDNDFSVKIRVGNAAVPFTDFDMSVIHQKDDKTLVFAVPILVLFQQPISVQVINNNGGTTTAVVKVSLHAELSLQPAACKSCGIHHPQNSGCPIPRGDA